MSSARAALALAVCCLSARWLGRSFLSSSTAGCRLWRCSDLRQRGAGSRSLYRAPARHRSGISWGLATSRAASVAAPADVGEAQAQEAYELWAEQFPIAAAREDFYGLPCGSADVRRRFLALAAALRIPAQEALTTFGPDLWVLCISEEKLLERLEALRSVAADEETVLEFVRFTPRSLGTTTADEIRQRGVENMKARAALGAGYEALTSPLRLLFKAMANRTAGQIRSTQGGDKIAAQERKTAGYVTLGVLSVIMGYLLYADYAYGGPIHGKGLCPASAIPTYNIPDEEGNARLPCNCAPIWKWYIEPQLAPKDRLRFQPKVESKNCGRQLGGAKLECDPTTPGGCVWTAEDLAKDPSTWDRRELLFWEKERLKLMSKS